MAVTVRAGSAVVSAGGINTAAATVTPTLPTGTVSGDRVFVLAGGGDGTAALTISDASWAQVYNLQLGGGTYSPTAGPRRQAAWYRDYDGVWAMPSVTAPAGPTSNACSACAVSVIPGSGETFDTPTAVTGSMATASTSLSAASSASNTWTTGGVVLLHDVFPGSTTTASGNVTATGVTFGTKTNTVTSGGVNTPNAVWTAPVSTGSATAATATHTATLGTSRTAGVGFVQQTSSAAASTLPRLLATRAAVSRAANF